MRLDPDLLDGPPGAGARVVALARCADVEEAASRVPDPADAEALHDLRVAVRRLRTTLDLLAPLLGDAVRPRQARRLRKAARVTGPARDAEVLVGWLERARERLQAPWRGAHDWLLERVERSRARALEKVATRALPRLAKATPALARRLSRPAPDRPVSPVSPSAPDTLAAALAPLLRAQVAALREALREVAGPEDVAGLHGARIAGKRLRYLLEPLRGVEGLEADEAVAALKALQDLLGDWHDAHQARQAVASALAEAAADRARWRSRGGGEADLRPGLLALGRLAAEREGALFAVLEPAYLAGRATPLLDLAYRVVAALEARSGAGDAPPAPERRLLLTGLPLEVAGAEVAGAEVEEVEQGWLPGERPRESVGVVRSALGELPFRARATGRGPATVEPLSRADFEALWPLTEGRRVARRSHRLPAEPGWRLDEYLDRRLVLAVAEPAAPLDGPTATSDERPAPLDEAGGEAPVPAWIEPVLVREVTGERGYTDEALARRPARGR